MGLNVSFEEAEVLKDRADAFLKNAEKLDRLANRSYRKEG